MTTKEKTRSSSTIQKKRATMLSAQQIADYFLFKARQDEELITNLKLQKLLYYAQGFHLAIFDIPLFEESIESWTYGPVVPEVYHRFKESSGGALPWIEEFDIAQINKEVIDLLDEVYSVYGQFSAYALANLSHSEPPWTQTPPGGVIDLGLMRDFFKTKVEINAKDSKTKTR